MTRMETIDTAHGSTHHERTAPRSRYPWFRKSKSETDKESWQRGRAVSGVAATASRRAVPTSLSSSTSSTAASGVVFARLAVHACAFPRLFITLLLCNDVCQHFLTYRLRENVKLSP